MGNPKHLTINETYDEDLCMVVEQNVVDDDKNCLYIVWNLADCPEDAIIGRDLLSAEEWVKAVEYGMQLAKDGYDSIEVTVNEAEEG